VLGELRTDLQAAGRDLGEIKTSCAVLVERSDRTERDVRDLEVRTAALERRVWTASGVAAAFGGAAGWLAQALGS
jgi:hypothetical protein